MGCLEGLEDGIVDGTDDGLVEGNAVFVVGIFEGAVVGSTVVGDWVVSKKISRHWRLSNVRTFSRYIPETFIYAPSDNFF